MPDLNCLESIRSPNILNPFLLQIREFIQKNRRASIDRLEQAMQQYIFHTGPASFDDLINLALHFQFIRVDMDSIYLTPTGETFCNKNPQYVYRLTEAQKDILITSILFGRNQLSKQFEIILEDFSYNDKTRRFEGTIIAPSGRLPALGIRLFCSSIGLINETDNSIYVINPSYTKDIRRKISIFRHIEMDGQEPTEEQLEKYKHAELLIYNAEKIRLISEGFTELSNDLQLVSEYNSSAGFDIQSFEGKGSIPGIHDRFIEVKSSDKNEIHFVLTGNELNKAKELKDKYHVFFVGNHYIGKRLDECRVEHYSNPVEYIFRTDKFAWYASRLHVTRKETDIEFSE